jgi:hypothetical protein
MLRSAVFVSLPSYKIGTFPQQGKDRNSSVSTENRLRLDDRGSILGRANYGIFFSSPPP